jgi:membrane protein YqaA with SNARE-associated domain
MSHQYFYLAMTVLAINLAPIFAPPTWTVLVLFKLNSNLDFLPLLLIGVTSAAIGRYLLGTFAGKFRRLLSEKMALNLKAAQSYLEHRRSTNLLNFLFFVISPLPSAQLFEAAGIVGMRLIPLTFAFLIGRLISYSFYLAGASSLKEKGLGQVITNNLKSPLGIGIQVASLIGIYFLTKIDWISLAKRRHNGVY